jgi:hypothetical protein
MYYLEVIKIELYDVVIKLTGDIRPIGSSQEDSKVMNNIVEYGRLLEYMIEDLIEIAEYRGSKEFSVNTIGDFAYSKLRNIKEKLNELL